jgi:sigma-54 dependent transcriptional regulator, acetoin dehydrogenase operon transcriptional activator AcoR
MAHTRGIWQPEETARGASFALLLTDADGQRQSELVELLYGGTLALSEDGTVIDADHTAAALLESNDRCQLVGRRIAELFGVKSEDLAAAPNGLLCAACGTSRRRVYFINISGDMLDSQQALLRACCAQAIARMSPQLAARSLTLEDLAGGDPQMLRNVRTARRVMDSDLPVLIQGPTGSGKEAFAQAMHAVSVRASKPFVAVNCAAIPESLIESELFGYRPGAFTGARREGMKGRILRSDGGTLFLDEIGDMPLALQTRLLRVLEDREIVPLGSETPLKVDLHVIAASHRNLREMIAQGTFRDDLYYRLNGITLELPALAERADREQVIQRVLSAESGDERPAAIEADALRCLLNYRWPGNVRELRNVIRMALAMREGDVIREIDLPREIRLSAHAAAATPLQQTNGAAVHSPEEPLPQSSDLLKDAERTALLQAIESCNGNLTRTAEQLGMSRNTLYRKMKRHGIAPVRRMDTVAA